MHSQVVLSALREVRMRQALRDELARRAAEERAGRERVTGAVVPASTVRLDGPLTLDAWGDYMKAKGWH